MYLQDAGMTQPEHQLPNGVTVLQQHLFADLFRNAYCTCDSLQAGFICLCKLTTQRCEA